MPIFAASLAWIGLIVFLFPGFSAWMTQLDQSRLVTDYAQQVESGLDPTAEQQLSLAHAYNRALDSGAFLEAGERLPTGAGTSAEAALDYWKILRADPLDVMARLRIPAIEVDLPIYHGTSDPTLERGVGHLEGTSLPVGGEGTHSVLTAHRGLATATMFTDLNKVKQGDKFTIEVLGEVLSYKVIDTRVVDPDEREALRTIEGEDLVTLVTCTPLGINTQRILVTGERITPTPIADIEQAGQESDVPGFPWWAFGFGAGTLLIGIYVWNSGRPTKDKGRPAAAKKPLASRD